MDASYKQSRPPQWVPSKRLQRYGSAALNGTATRVALPPVLPIPECALLADSNSAEVQYDFLMREAGGCGFSRAFGTTTLECEYLVPQSDPLPKPQRHSHFHDTSTVIFHRERQRK